MKLRPPKKEVTGARVEVYEKQSWARWPHKQKADLLAQRLGDVIADHTDLKGWLGVRVRVETEDRCPDCGYPYEPNEADAGEDIAGFCAWDGCDLREPEGGPEEGPA